MSTEQPPEGEGYDLQAVYAEKAKPYWFKWQDRWWKLPHLRMLDFEVQAEIEAFDFANLVSDDSTKDELEAAKEHLNELFDLIMGAEQGKAWRDVERPFNMLMDMLAGWTKHSGAAEGEAPASDGSSKSTGRPSKRTSNGSTASASRKRSPAKPPTPARQDKATPAKRARAATVKDAIQRENS